MRKTIVINPKESIAELLGKQQGTVDPTALINRLIHDEIRRRGVRVDPELIAQIEQDKVAQGLELFMDENTHAAG